MLDFPAPVDPMVFLAWLETPESEASEPREIPETLERWALLGLPVLRRRDSPLALSLGPLENLVSRERRESLDSLATPDTPEPPVCPEDLDSLESRERRVCLASLDREERKEDPEMMDPLE